MGTNFYARTNICRHCNRYEETHIGKRSYGHQFLFAGHDHIKSFDDLCNFLCITEAKIFDEENRQISYCDFLRMIKEIENDPNSKKQDPTDFRSCAYDFLIDSEGYPFLFGEFS